MSASEVMPFFIKPSRAMDATQKQLAYQKTIHELDALLDDQSNRMTIMSTINCLLKTNLTYYYWVGFYILTGSRLEVGPYQGTLGCLYIDLDKGVCGKAATTRQPQIIKDCHQLKQGIDHIACDPHSRSEIVMPVFDSTDELIAVHDVDSTLVGSFDEVDERWLEKILKYVQ